MGYFATVGSPVARRLRLAFDLFKAGSDLMLQNFRRKHPDETAARIRMNRIMVALCGIFLACGPHTSGSSTTVMLTTGTASTTSQGSSTADVSTSESTVPTTGPDPLSTSTADGTTTSSSGGIPTDPVNGEWVGTYTTGLGFVTFQACGEEDIWPLADGSLPYFNFCAQAPLWLRVKGTVTTDGNYKTLAVTSILEGPCTVGACDSGFSGCSDFDSLCN